MEVAFEVDSIEERIIRDDKGISNYMNVSIEEMDWLVKRAKQAEKYEQGFERILNHCRANYSHSTQGYRFTEPIIDMINGMLKEAGRE